MLHQRFVLARHERHAVFQPGFPVVAGFEFSRKISVPVVAVDVTDDRLLDLAFVYRLIKLGNRHFMRFSGAGMKLVESVKRQNDNGDDEP